MNTSYTDTQLKLALAKKLPNLIELTEYVPFGGDGSVVIRNFFWKHGVWREGIVSAREWLWIVAEVEKTLDAGKQMTFRRELISLVMPIERCGWTKAIICHATWQQRATALQKIGVI